jgi:quercetin dioxygenase-like cupin family protein
MTRDEFEAALRRDGYEVGESNLAPLTHNSDHAHDYDVRALVLAGEFTLTFGTERHTYRAGEIFACDRGNRHTEDVGPEGVRYVVGRRRG